MIKSSQRQINLYDKDKKEFWSDIQVKTIFYPLCCLNVDAEKSLKWWFQGRYDIQPNGTQIIGLIMYVTLGLMALSLTTLCFKCH